MKKLLLSTSCVLLVFIYCSSQTSMLLLNENFTGLSGIGLGPSNGQWSNANANAFVQVNSMAPLFNPNYTSGSQYVSIAKTANADDPYKTFSNSQSISATSNTVVYISFLVRVDNASGTVNAGNNAQNVLALGNNGSNDHLGFFIGNNGNGTNDLKFGINKSGSNGANFASGSYAFGSAHLVVIKYVYVSGSNNDLMYMWVDPAISIYSSELSVNTAVLTLNNGTDNSLTLNTVGFEQNNNGADASFDGLRVSYATPLNGSSVASNSAAAWTALSPAGQPLPLKFGTIKAASSGNNIRIEWETYFEENISNYEVERSADGQNFNSIAGVISLNSIERKVYNYTDENPIQGNNFFRIRSVDIDGRSILSNVVKVNMNSKVSSLSIYPNPTQGSSVSLQLSNLLKAVYNVEIINLSGIAVYKTQISYSGNSTIQNFQLPELNAGHYAVVLTGEKTKMTRSLLVL